MIPTGIIHAVGSVGWAGLFSTGIGNTPFEDTVEAVLKLATDTSVNGEVLRLMSRVKANSKTKGGRWE